MLNKTSFADYSAELLTKEIDFAKFLRFFKNKTFCKLTSFQQQIYIIIYIYDNDNRPLTISKISQEIKKSSSSVRRTLKQLEEMDIVELKVHLSNEINRELTFIYLKQKLDMECSRW